MGKGEIWVYGREQEAAAQIAKALDGGNLINPVRVLEEGADFRVIFHDNVAPLLLLLDLSAARVWEVIGAAREINADEGMAMIALVDDSTEHLLDKAYDAGVKTYLRKPVDFADFVLSARLLKLNLLIEKPE